MAAATLIPTPEEIAQKEEEDLAAASAEVTRQLREEAAEQLQIEIRIDQKNAAAYDKKAAAAAYALNEASAKKSAQGNAANIKLLEEGLEKGITVSVGVRSNASGKPAGGAAAPRKKTFDIRAMGDSAVIAADAVSVTNLPHTMLLMRRSLFCSVFCCFFGV